MRHLMKQRASQLGLSLIELMITVAIGGVLLTAASPYMSEFIANSRLRESGNLLLTETLIAQSEAIKRNTRVRLATAGNTIQVLDITTPALPVVLRERSTTGGALLPTANIEFGSEGRPVPFGTSAQIDVTNPQGCSADLRCPGLRVEAGGAVRLCGNQLSCS